ncbi:MAG: agmatinase [Candidatus Micrarchaeia archaeon]
MFLHTYMPYAFGGIQTPLEKSRVVIIPVPYDGTTTFRAGSRDGPHAMIVASRAFEDYDMELGKELAYELGFHTTDEVEPDTGSPLGMVGRVQEAVEAALELKKFPVVFGGEHTITLGAVRAFGKRYKEFSVLQIDAHGDMRAQYENSPYNHACVMRRIREEKCVKNAVQVGVRSLCKEETEFIEKAGIGEYIYYDNKFDTKKIVSQLGENVYITVDLDGLDPSIMPAVGTPEPNGLLWEQTMGLLREVTRKKKIIGFDVNELCPLAGNPASDLVAGKLAYKLIGYSFFPK